MNLLSSLRKHMALDAREAMIVQKEGYWYFKDTQSGKLSGRFISYKQAEEAAKQAGYTVVF